VPGLNSSTPVVKIAISIAKGVAGNVRKKGTFAPAYPLSPLTLTGEVYAAILAASLR